jgi:dienelactone hydrolase
MLLGLACAPELTPKTPPAVVVARFDPGRNPPLVPTPNDLAEDPVTGLLNITPAPDASEADKAFIAYLNTLNGFPASSGAATTFEAPLDSATVNTSTVRVFDLTDNNAPVEGVSLVYTEQPQASEAKSTLTIKGPGGFWVAGHTYAVALIGGDNGLKGMDGQPVVGTAAWMLLRSAKSLVTCEDLSSEDCQSATDLIPSQEEDPARKRADQARTALRLEPIRRKYKSALDHLESQGIPRADVALLWTFKVADLPQAVFNPSVVPARVPSPNDLAIDPATGLVNVPLHDGMSEAEKEFTRDYLNTLTGFPAGATASVEVAGGDLAPESISTESVRLYEKQAGAWAPSTFSPVVGFDTQSKRLTLVPPAGSTWPKGRTFAVVLVADKERGLRTTDGKVPVGSEVWAFLRMTVPLVTCDDLASPTCDTAVSIAPVGKEDALRLEGIRRGYGPLFERLAQEGIARESVPLLFTFTLVPNPEALFDPANKRVPFPTNLVLVPANAEAGTPQHVDLGDPEEQTTESGKQLIAGLNALDGFSTTASHFSLLKLKAEDPAPRILDLGRLDPASLMSGGVGFVHLAPQASDPEVDVSITSYANPEADVLRFTPKAPLAGKSTYGGYFSRNLRDSEGREVIASAAFALMRSSHPLYDAERGRSLVPVLQDAQAMELERARLALAPLMDALASRGIPRKDVTLAWSATTQSIRDMAEQLAQLPNATALTTEVTHLNSDLTNVLAPSSLYSAVNQNPFPYDNLGRVYIGRLQLPHYPTAADGRIDFAQPRTVEVPFILTLPKAAPAAGSAGYPVVVWGHPITSYRLSLLGIANGLAGRGMATLSIDLPHHGERASCVGAKDSLALAGATTDDAACIDPATQMCQSNRALPAYGRCVARAAASRKSCTYSPLPLLTLQDDAGCFAQDQGFCLADGKCEGGTWKKTADNQPAISGWDFIDGNFFVTRNNVLQSVADLAQLVRVLQASDARSLRKQLETANANDKLDPARIHYVGMSLGGITGAVATSAVPAVKRVVLNAAGADLPGVLLTGLTPEARAAFLEKLAASGFVQGTPEFDQFINVLRWVMDPADPANQAGALVHASAERQVLVQYITRDPVIPNSNSERLYSAAARGATAPALRKVVNDAPDSVGGPDRHGYLVTGAATAVLAGSPLKTVTTQAQTQVGNFLQNGSVP